jgi:hypothetical protein
VAAGLDRDVVVAGDRGAEGVDGGLVLGDMLKGSNWYQRIAFAWVILLMSESGTE